MEKIALLISQGLEILGKKIDSLAEALREQKTPEINIPTFPQPIVNVPEPQITVNVPPFEIPTPIVNIEKQDPPIVNVPAPIVEVNVPPVYVPQANITVEPAKVEFPKEMKVEGMKELLKNTAKEQELSVDVFKEVTSKSPLSVSVIGKDGKVITDFGGEFSAPSMVSLKVGNTAVGDDNLLPVTTDGFSIPVFDTQVIDESAAPATTTITYKRAGATVATKVITVLGTTTTITVTIS